MSTKLKFCVPAEYDGCLVKVFLRSFCRVSAHLLVKLKRTPEGITCNGKHIRAIDTLNTGDIVELCLPEDENAIPSLSIPLKILYEDEHILIVDKPPFLPVHPVHGHIDDTLANAVAAYFRSKGENHTFRAINRLDKDTSGIVLLAKDSYTAALLHKHVQKTYMAVCEGVLTGNGTIDEPIRLMEGHSIQREVGEGGARSITHWKAIKNNNEFTLLEINLETGRTHQIRVHFSYLGYPLAGDDMYGGKQNCINRHALHCSSISFIHPVSGKTIEITSNIPDDMQSLI